MLLRRAAPMTPHGLTFSCYTCNSCIVRFSANSQILLEVHAAVAGGADDTAWLRGIFDGFAAQGFRITALAPLLDGRLDALAVTLVKVGCHGQSFIPAVTWGRIRCRRLWRHCMRSALACWSLLFKARPLERDGS